MIYALPVTLIANKPTPLEREMKRCTGKLTVTGDGVGAVRVGESLAQVKKVCRIRPVRLKKGERPPPDDLLDFKIGPTPVQAQIEGGRVWRIVVDGPLLKTGDRLGVGSPVSALLAAGPARASQREGVIYASLPNRCGLIFQLSYRPRRGEDRDAWTPDTLALLPAEAVIERVLISGCR